VFSAVWIEPHCSSSPRGRQDVCVGEGVSQRVLHGSEGCHVYYNSGHNVPHCWNVQTDLRRDSCVSTDGK